MITITKEFLFDAAHKLHCSRFSEEKNHEMYGKCNLFHGHTYRLQVSVSGKTGPDGMIINFSKLKKLVTDKIISKYDHTNLNELDEYALIPTTAENMAQYMFNCLEDALLTHNVHLQSVVLYETPTSWATVTRDA